MRLPISVAASAMGFLLALCVPTIAQTQQAAPAQAKQTKPICANCHEDKWNAIDLTAHGARNDSNGSMCQNCHGDATEHLKDPLKAKPPNPFAQGKPASEQAAVCLTCHSGNRNLAFWTSGKHAINEVACSNCHSIQRRCVLKPSSSLKRDRYLVNAWSCHQSQ